MPRCPALLVTAPASGQGKTMLTAALARYHRRQGRRVLVFKTGPDFLDPMILAQASGSPVYQLDLWMGGESHCRQLLSAAAQEADLILVEGVMGAYDGEPSSADLAETLELPLLAVIDAGAMAQTFAALAEGLLMHRPGLNWAGVVANRVAGDYHARMLAEQLDVDVLLAAIPKAPAIELPGRYLGLIQASEIDDLDQRLDHAADLLDGTALAVLPPAVEFPPVEAESPMASLQGVTIGVARDAAFSFIYPANLDCLQTLGARLIFFSPLNDPGPPEVDSIWLPGGYPELYLDVLATNYSMVDALREHHAAGKPMLAECGGMLYLCRRLTDKQGKSAQMVGLVEADAVMQPQLAALGLQGAAFNAGQLRGHSFHYSCLNTDWQPCLRTDNPNGGQGEDVYCEGRLTASYAHFYFPSSPSATAALLQA